MPGRSERRRGFQSVEGLDAFFASCDERELGREPDWEQHLEVINRPKDSGLSAT